ncbi:MAG: DNA adenine methylase [Rhodobacter sp.]|nr:DNA adenine methylase [Rhodobacter sp.]
MSLPATRAVEPIRPPAPYLGGKRRLAARIVGLIEQIPHSLYAEPFVGMGGVFFRRRAAAHCEVINDGSRDVATFFRVLQRHYTPFLDMLRFQLSARAEFERLVATRPDTLTDLERAARFLYLQRVGWGGKVTGRTFGPVYAGSARFNLLRVAPLLEDVHSRLAGVVIGLALGQVRHTAHPISRWRPDFPQQIRLQRAQPGVNLRPLLPKGSRARGATVALDIAPYQVDATGLDQAITTAGRLSMGRKNGETVVPGRLTEPCFATGVAKLAEHVSPLRLLRVARGQRPCLAEARIGVLEALPEEGGRIAVQDTGDRS